MKFKFTSIALFTASIINFSLAADESSLVESAPNTGIESSSAPKAEIETINTAAIEAFNKFQADLTAKEAELESKNDKVTVTSSNPNELPTDPQADLNELASYFKVLNYADMAALDFISRHCSKHEEEGVNNDDSLFVSSTDPNLCFSYQLLLIKGIEGRLRSVTSHYLYYDKVLKAPKEWPEHAWEILKKLEGVTSKLPTQNRSNYTLERVILKGMKEVSEGKSLNNADLPIPQASPLPKMIEEQSSIPKIAAVSQVAAIENSTSKVVLATPSIPSVVNTENTTTTGENTDKSVKAVESPVKAVNTVDSPVVQDSPTSNPDSSPPAATPPIKFNSIEKTTQL